MSTSLGQQSFSQLLQSFSSPDPTPGGGSAAALAGALGASLFAMVAGLPKTRTGTVEERTALDGARTTLLALQTTLTALADRDAAAYDHVVAAFKKPKATDEEKAARKAAVQTAMRGAADVPMETLRTALDAIAAGSIVALYGNPSAKSDVAVGLHLLMTAAQGAWFNVLVNLEAISDPGVVQGYVTELKGRVADLSAGVRAIYQSPALSDLMRDMVAQTGIQHVAPQGGAVSGPD